MDAIKVLGYKHPLNLRENFHKKIIQEALDNGASFESPDDARRYVRKEISSALWVVLLGVVMAGFLIVAYHFIGWQQGIETGLEICKLIVVS